MVHFDSRVKYNVKDVSRRLEGLLAPAYGAGEAKAMVRLIFHHLKGWDATALIINHDREVSEFTLGKIDEIVGRLLQHEPLQYILGEARFYGMDLEVNRSVLIPRHETEELVDLIADHEKDADLTVLDVGTGSGAIAIALARNLAFARVTALDVSEAALEVARRNASRLKVRIDFVHADIFTYVPEEGAFDIVVSNPPYVTEKEKGEMEANVLDYEPSGALFVPDDAPLIYYSRIAEVAAHGLKPGGRLYFEINPLYATEMTTMLRDAGFTRIETYNDISGRPRMMRCELRN